jgi:hypothetical protein
VGSHDLGWGRTALGAPEVPKARLQSRALNFQPWYARLPVVLVLLSVSARRSRDCFLQPPRPDGLARSARAPDPLVIPVALAHHRLLNRSSLRPAFFLLVPQHVEEGQIAIAPRVRGCPWLFLGHRFHDCLVGSFRALDLSLFAVRLRHRPIVNERRRPDPAGGTVAPFHKRHRLANMDPTPLAWGPWPGAPSCGCTLAVGAPRGHALM